MRIGRASRLLAGLLTLTLAVTGCDGVSMEIGGGLTGGGLPDIDPVVVDPSDAAAGAGAGTETTETTETGTVTETEKEAGDAGEQPADGRETGDGQAQAPSKGVVKMAVKGWAGYGAGAGVLAYLLEKKLGYIVERRKLTERASWEGFESGAVDVIAENWGHEDLKKTFIRDRRVAIDAGPTGNRGVVGWYVPQWMADAYPGITDYRNLNRYAYLFRTPKSQGKGQLFFGRPSYVGNEEALIKNLNLDLKVVVGDGQAELIRSVIRAQRHRRPLLFYFWNPHWLFGRVKLARVRLPPHTAGCDTDPGKITCGYAEVALDKIVSRKFAANGGKAFKLVRNFTWTNEDQNAVAADIATRGMSAEEAARKWVEANEATWTRWLLAG